MDIEQLIYEADRLQNAMSLLNACRATSDAMLASPFIGRMAAIAQH